MTDYVLGERRLEPRQRADELPSGFHLKAPGLRGIEVIDASTSGLRVRTTAALRPGRALTIGWRPDRHRPEMQCIATVVWCAVHRLGRASVTYEAALRLRPAGAREGGA